MLGNRSIRFRLTVWYAVILTAGLSLFGGLIYWSLSNRLMGEIDEDLAGRAGRFEKYFRAESVETATNAQLRDELREFCQALPPASYIDLRDGGRFAFRYPERAAAPAEDLRILRRQFDLNGEVFHLEVGAPIRDVRHTLRLLRILLWSFLPVVIAIACIGGAWLSGRALKPVHDITAAALTISIENLSERLPVPATGDELARLTEVLNTMLARLEGAVKTLSQFVADASHELRTPLAVIHTTAELALRRARMPESYRESLHEVVAETERMTQLVEDLLLLARSDTDVASMPLAGIDVREVLRDVCVEVRGLAENREIRVNAWLGDEPAVISGNRPALHRLFLALLDNAMKYSPAAGAVNIRVQRDESRVAVAIEDFGSGISGADLPHIFQRFYRAAGVRGDEGHGLGLALAQSVARAHGAVIQVESTEGAGSVFRIVFVSREARTVVNQAINAAAISSSA